MRIAAVRILGQCTADPPVQPGDYFSVRNGDIRIPPGGSVCLWALQSILPLITPKEREILEAPDQDWMWRVHRAQCPDPAGRVLFEIERVGEASETRESAEQVAEVVGACGPEQGDTGVLRSLRVVVEEVRGRCTSGMQPGDFFLLRSGKLYIPPERHFCLYALHAALPLLPAKQRAWADEDWLKETVYAICPDPAGNVLMRIEEVSDPHIS